MEGNEQGSMFDTFRLVLYVILIISLISPGNHGQNNNLRDSEEQQRIKAEKMALENTLDRDMEYMESVDRFAYNISGVFKGSWELDKDPASMPSYSVSLDVQKVLKRKPLNSSLESSGGSLSLQLYDHGRMRRNMHYVTGVLTLNDGKDEDEEALSLSLTGLYFFPLGRLTLFANTYGTRYYLEWKSPANASSTATNRYPDLIGYSNNGTNVLFLSSPIRYQDVATRCLYRFDADFLPLPDSLHRDVSQNPHSQALLNATGILVGSNCNTSVRFRFEGHNMDTAHLTHKSRVYTVVFIIVSFVECMVMIKMTQRLLLTSAFAASVVSFLAVSALDLLTALSHSLMGISYLGLFSELYFISFHKFFVFSVIEMRLIFVIWRSHREEINAENVLQYQRKLSGMFLLLYFVILVTLISVYSGSAVGYALLFALFSFWVPQIVRSLQLGQRPPFDPKYILLLSACVLSLPLYVVACPYNLLNAVTDYALPRGYGVSLIVWVVLQVGVETCCEG